MPRRACIACFRCRYKAPASNAPDPPPLALRKAVRRGTCRVMILFYRVAKCCHAPGQILLSSRESKTVFP